MLQIQDKLVSLDLIDHFFCCDLDSCHGKCCIEGDAGAPITLEEFEKISSLVTVIEDYITPSAREVIKKQGVGYYDQDGELVTSIVDGRDCVFTTYAPGNKCLCALEKAYREGKTDFCKPASCALYPIRLKQFPTFTAVNLHKWDICACAETAGKKNGIRAYQFLREPLIKQFGEEWYDELDFTAQEYLRQKSGK